MQDVKDYLSNLSPWQAGLVTVAVIIACIATAFFWGRSSDIWTPPVNDPSMVQNDNTTDGSSSRILNESAQNNEQTSSQSNTPIANQVSPEMKTLSSITITGGKDALVSFTTNGLSTSGYIITWTNLDHPNNPPVPDGVNTDVMVYESSPGVHSGTGKLFNLRNALGKYQIHICENVGNSCGKRSNVIYLTVTREPGCSDDPTTPCASAATMKYSFY
jgi:hypothetical protein